MQKNILYIGILCVLIIFSFLNWAKEQVTYDHIYKTAMSKFKNAEKIFHDHEIPEIKIADPEGKITFLPKKGKFMLVNLWSIRCKNCVTNLHILHQLQRVFNKSDKNWEVICVSIDDVKDLEYVSSLIKRYDIIKLAGYYDAYKSLQKFTGAKLMPVTLIINDKGKVLYKIYGENQWLDPDILTFLRSISSARNN